MINGSFVFGMDADDADVFARTVEWAVEHGIETATFHILTPYPGTALHKRLVGAGSNHQRQLGSVRHAACRVPAGADDGRGARKRLLEGVSRLLPVEIHRSQRVCARRARRWSATLRVRCRVEEVRTACGTP